MCDVYMRIKRADWFCHWLRGVWIWLNGFGVYFTVATAQSHILGTALIAVNRWQRPRQPLSLDWSNKRVIVYLCIQWLCPVFFSLPIIKFGRYGHDTQRRSTNVNMMILHLFSGALLLASAALLNIIMYTLTFHAVREQRKQIEKHNKNNNRNSSRRTAVNNSKESRKSRLNKEIRISLIGCWMSLELVFYTITMTVFVLDGAKYDKWKWLLSVHEHVMYLSQPYLVLAFCKAFREKFLQMWLPCWNGNSVQSKPSSKQNVSGP